jgi:hypothetical protein
MSNYSSKVWWPLKVVNEDIEISVLANSYEEAKAKFEKCLQRKVEEGVNFKLRK